MIAKDIVTPSESELHLATGGILMSLVDPLGITELSAQFLAGSFLDAGSAIGESHKLSAREKEISERRAKFDVLSDEQKKVFARRMNEFNSKRS